MLSVDVSGKRAFVAGIADDRGYGWAIAKALAEAGAYICVGVWPPMRGLFERALRSGRLDTRLPGGGELYFEKVYSMDALTSFAGAIRGTSRGRLSLERLRHVTRHLIRPASDVRLLMGKAANGGMRALCTCIL